MKTLDIQYRQAQSVNIDLGMLDIATFFEHIFIVGNRRLLHKQKSVSYRRILNIFSVNVNTFQVAFFPMKEMKFLVGGVPANYSHG